MSNIDLNSLVFALPNDEDPTAKVIMCQMPMDMIMNWMAVVSPHSEKYLKVQKYYIALAINSGIPEDDIDKIYDHANTLGMKNDIQILMMEVIGDLRETMGDEDFMDLYQMETTEEDDAFLSSQNWVGLNPDGTSQNAKLVNDVPEWDADSVEQND